MLSRNSSGATFIEPKTLTYWLGFFSASSPFPSLSLLPSPGITGSCELHAPWQSTLRGTTKKRKTQEHEKRDTKETAQKGRRRKGQGETGEGNMFVSSRTRSVYPRERLVREGELVKLEIHWKKEKERQGAAAGGTPETRCRSHVPSAGNASTAVGGDRVIRRVFPPEPLKSTPGKGYGGMAGTSWNRARRCLNVRGIVQLS